jgi:hypothetical protein
VQVYEIRVPQSLTSLTAAIFADGEKGQGHLEKLTEVLASRLGLTEYLEMQPRSPGCEIRIPGLLTPFERLVSLRIREDPTAVTNPRQQAQNGLFGVSPEGMSEIQRVPVQRPKSEVPERYLKPWEFRLSRDEAVYDMQHTQPAPSALTRWILRLTTGVTFADELQRWRVLLSGKSLDEQLWGIRPPKNSFSQPDIRQWVLNTLQQAGYDAQTMMLEWEIFWRRKGL